MYTRYLYIKKYGLYLGLYIRKCWDANPQEWVATCEAGLHVFAEKPSSSPPEHWIAQPHVL